MIQHIKGKVSRQAHVAVLEGLYEDELGRQGFSGRVSTFRREGNRLGDHSFWLFVSSV